MKKSYLLLFTLLGLSLLFSCETDSPSPDGTSSAAFEAEMLSAVNAIRTEGCTCGSTVMPAVSPLTWDSKLTNAAIRHSRDMRDNNNHSHTGTDGSTLGQRVTAANYTWSNVGENIAWGQTSVAQVIASWKNSEGHCKNMMNANFEHLGAANRGDKWVQVFGAEL